LPGFAGQQRAPSVQGSRLYGGTFGGIFGIVTNGLAD
jgi:hypothetical protein